MTGTAMAIFPIVLFLHVFSAIGLFVALALEWASLRKLGRSTTYEQARDWTGLWSTLLPLGLPAVLVVLTTGIYLAATLGPGMWTATWVKAAVPALVLVALAGAVVGPRRSRLRSALASGAGSLSSDLRLQLGHPLLVASWRWRAALLTGLVFLMTAKPESSGALLAIGSFAIAGLAWSALRLLP
jgi:hypothetical protein